MRRSTVLMLLATSLTGVLGCGSSSDNPDSRVDSGRRDRGRADTVSNLDGNGPGSDTLTDGKPASKEASAASCPASAQAAATLTAGTPGTDVTGKLDDPAKGACFYKFDGKKGDRVWVGTTAKPEANPYDETYVDTVLELLDSSEKQLALNDDPSFMGTNDAQLVTILPADGTYYVRVSDCNNSPSAPNCSPATGITNKDFTVNVTTLSYPWVIGEGAEPNDTTDKSTAITYTKSSQGTGYLPNFLWGLFQTAADVDVFTVNIPSDAPVTAGTRAGTQVSMVPWGTSGDGSTAPLGKIWIVDPADATHRVAELDASQGKTPGDLSPPLKVNTPYYLFVSRAAGTPGANDFYFLIDYVGGGNPVEADEGTGAKNDTAATAAGLTVSTSAAGRYYVEGDLSTATDVDFFAAAVPANLTDKTVSVACGAQRSGSGLRGFKASVFKSDGTTALATGASGTEMPALRAERRAMRTAPLTLVSAELSFTL